MLVMRNVISSKDFWQWLKSRVSQEDCRQVWELLSVVRTVVMVGTHVSGGDCCQSSGLSSRVGVHSDASGGDSSAVGTVVRNGDSRHQSWGLS